MRKRSVELLASLCAANPKRAIVDALLDIKSMSKAELEVLVDELKKQAPPSQPRTQKKPTSEGDGSPKARIQRLLTKEARLSPVQSVAELRAELAKTVNIPIPPPSASLDGWLTTALAAIPPSEVLNAAMIIAQKRQVP